MISVRVKICSAHFRFEIPEVAEDVSVEGCGANHKKTDPCATLKVTYAMPKAENRVTCTVELL